MCGILNMFGFLLQPNGENAVIKCVFLLPTDPNNLIYFPALMDDPIRSEQVSGELSARRLLSLAL
jgi:hypothetical protein